VIVADPQRKFNSPESVTSGQQRKGRAVLAGPALSHLMRRSTSTVSRWPHIDCSVAGYPL